MWQKQNKIWSMPVSWSMMAKPPFWGSIPVMKCSLSVQAAGPRRRLRVSLRERSSGKRPLRRFQVSNRRASCTRSSGSQLSLLGTCAVGPPEPPGPGGAPGPGVRGSRPQRGPQWGESESRRDCPTADAGDSEVFVEGVGCSSCVVSVSGFLGVGVHSCGVFGLFIGVVRCVKGDGPAWGVVEG